MKKIRFVDLFAGIGGMRLGFERAADSLKLISECVLSCELDADSRSVYEENFGEYPLGDIRLIDELPPHEVLLAGFPCQPFSYAGRQAGFGDTRGTLFFEITRLIDTYKPVAFILENVRGLLSNDKGRTLETIKHEFKIRGYSFDAFLLNSANFELPQNRLRVYLVGVLNSTPKFHLYSETKPLDSYSDNPDEIPWLDPECKPITVADILEEEADKKYNCSQEFVNALKRKFNGDLNGVHGMRIIDRIGSNSIYSWELGLRGKCTADEIKLMNSFILNRRDNEFGKGRDHKMLTKEQIRSFFPHKKLEHLLNSLVAKNYLKKVKSKYKTMTGNFSFEVYKFLEPNKIAVTLVASDANRLGVYYQNRLRKITPREAARLQGFPDDFLLHENDDRAYYQLGNSVSINVVESVAEEVLLNIKPMLLKKR